MSELRVTTVDLQDNGSHAVWIDYKRAGLLFTTAGRWAAYVQDRQGYLVKTGSLDNYSTREDALAAVVAAHKAR